MLCRVPIFVLHCFLFCFFIITIVGGRNNSNAPSSHSKIVNEFSAGRINLSFHKKIYCLKGLLLHYCMVMSLLITLDVVLFFIPGCTPPILSTTLPWGWYNAPVLSFINDYCSGVSVKLITWLLPAFRNILLKPFRDFTGAFSLVSGYEIYSCTTSSPSLAPVFRTITSTVSFLFFCKYRWSF